MKNLLLILTVLSLGCAKDPISNNQSNNLNFQVETLFMFDSIKVYRFSDSGRHHYFTKDMTITTHSCGKGCNYDEIIKNTNGK